MTGPSRSKDRWVPRLTEDGEPGNPAVDLRRSSSANSEGIQQDTRKQLPGLDVGGLIEVRFSPRKTRGKLVSVGGNWCECVFSQKDALTPLIYAGELPFALPAGAVAQLGTR